jgi:hypothetical protein
MEFIIFTSIGIVALLCWLIYLLGRLIRPINAIFSFALLLATITFILSIASYRQDYYQLANGNGLCYTPFAPGHKATLFTFLVLSFAALVLVWLKLRSLPPLILVMLVSLVITGIVLHTFIIIQTGSNTEFWDGYGFFPLPITYIVIASVILFRLLKAEATLSAERNYRYPWLNRINQLMADTKLQPLWMILMALPLFLFIMLVLVIFGQAPTAIAKVFTETTTWTFSTKSHPPLLDYDGHYLCTVAACGNANVVKPIGWGSRRGYPILVNRQLQIANAFEEMVQDYWPALHSRIRKLYDKYGYPLSKKITSPYYSNITYKLMKPLEYFFLFTLYLFCVEPERKIIKQYSLK